MKNIHFKFLPYLICLTMLLSGCSSNYSSIGADNKGVSLDLVTGESSSATSDGSSFELQKMSDTMNLEEKLIFKGYISLETLDFDKSGYLQHPFS